MFVSDEDPTLETLDFTIRIGSTSTFFYCENLIVKINLEFFLKIKKVHKHSLNTFFYLRIDVLLNTRHFIRNI